MKNAVNVVLKWFMSPEANTSSRGYRCDTSCEQDSYEDLAWQMGLMRKELSERHGVDVAESLFPKDLIDAYTELSKAPTGEWVEQK